MYNERIMNMTLKNFETSIQELEKIVAGLETGDITLDESLALFEKGIKLSKSCRRMLDEAEKKVKLLVADNNGDVSLSDFGGEE